VPEFWHLYSKYGQDIGAVNFFSKWRDSTIVYATLDVRWRNDHDILAFGAKSSLLSERTIINMIADKQNEDHQSKISRILSKYLWCGWHEENQSKESEMIQVQVRKYYTRWLDE
jgi:hypothetical protein